MANFGSHARARSRDANASQEAVAVAPKELRVEVYDERVPVALLRDLAALFGPLQYRTLSRATEIVEPSVSP
jgi:hypothetical protein